MRYAVTGTDEATGKRVAVEFEVSDEAEARALAVLQGIEVETVAEVPGARQEVNARALRKPAADSSGADRLVFRARGTAVEYLVVAAALVGGGLYLGATWHWWLVAPFVVVLAVASYLTRRATVSLTADAIVHRPALGPVWSASYYHVAKVSVMSYPNGTPYAVIVELENGSTREIQAVGNLPQLAAEIAARKRL